MPSKKRPAKKSPKRTAAAAPKKKKLAVAKKAAPKKTAARKPVAKKKKPVARKPVAAAAKKAVTKKAAAKKPVAKKAAPKKAAPKPIEPMKAAPKPAPRPKALGPKTAPVRRRDGAGHLDATYAESLRSQSTPPEREGKAFVDGEHVEDDLSEEMGESFVETATSGEDESEDNANEVTTEERGGPFVVTTAGTEFADGVDGSNPKGSKREPFPTT